MTSADMDKLLKALDDTALVQQIIADIKVEKPA